jgi:drug/metabolite transporter (DMT)-like permease
MAGRDWALMAALCVTGATGHWLLIKCYEVAEASAVQPFAYFQLVFAVGVGVWIFGETLAAHVVLGAAIVVAAGIFTLWRESVRRRRERPSSRPA